MRRMANRLKQLREQAAQLQQVVGGVPAQAAALRQAVAEAGVPLRELRAEVLANLGGLRADGDERMLEILGEIQAGAGVLARAGYAWSRVDMDVGGAGQLVVELEQVEVVPERVLFQLQSEQTRGSVLHALMAAIIKAQALARKVSLPGLGQQVLRVQVGTIPGVRVSWRVEEEDDERPTLPVSTPAVKSGPRPASGTMGTTLVGSGSFFESRSTPPPLPDACPPEAPDTSKVGRESELGGSLQRIGRSAGGGSREAVEATADGGNALDRFKKMPDLTKRGNRSRR